MTLELMVNRKSTTEKVFNCDKMDLRDIDYSALLKYNKLIITNVPDVIEYEISKFIFNKIDQLQLELACDDLLNTIEKYKDL